MRKRFMVFILVLGVLFTPAIAFADDFGGSDGGDFSDRVIYGPNVLNIQSGTYGVQVYAGNKFNAALCVLGFDGNDSRFTNDVKAYLSNESTGGSFYEFSNLFTNNNSPNIGGFDAYNITFTSAIGTNNTLYGAEFVWIAQYTDTLRQAAYARVEEILNGNTGGGSTPLPDDGTYIKLPVTVYGSAITGFSYNNGWYISYAGSEESNRCYKLSGTDYYTARYATNNKTNEASNYEIRMPKTTYQNLMNVVDGLGWSDAAVLIQMRNRGNYLTYNARVIHKSNAEKCSPDGYFIGYSYDSSVEYVQLSAPNETINLVNGSWPSDVQSLGDSLQFHSDTYSILGTYHSDELFNTYNCACILFDKNGTVGDEPVVPPTQWPEPDPVTPTEPPEVPTPTPTEPPTEPTITVPTAPTLPPLTYPTEPTYQTPDIAAILDAMARHCVHLQECMKNVSDDYYDSMTAYMLTLQNKDFEFLRSWFRVTIDTIRDCFDDLSDYLQRLFTWLADQMDFTFTGGDFDDSSIVGWLKKIYSKLGSGTTVKPTDPVVDPTGIGDWLDQLLKNFVLDLLALGQDALADVAEMFRQLITKFPFSIPWDIAAMLALFAATPQIPVIEIPQYALTGNGISQVGMYTIDLTPYDGAMGIARSVENVVFAFWLAWKIDFFKAILTGVLGGDK